MKASVIAANTSPCPPKNGSECGYRGKDRVGLGEDKPSSRGRNLSFHENRDNKWIPSRLRTRSNSRIFREKLPMAKTKMKADCDGNDDVGINNGKNSYKDAEITSR